MVRHTPKTDARRVIQPRPRNESGACQHRRRTRLCVRSCRIRKEGIVSVMTAAETNKETIRRYFASMDRQDFAGVAETLAPGCQGHFGGNPETLDAQGLQGFAMSFLAALADV